MRKLMALIVVVVLAVLLAVGVRTFTMPSRQLAVEIGRAFV